MRDRTRHMMGELADAKERVSRLEFELHIAAGHIVMASKREADSDQAGILRKAAERAALAARGVFQALDLIGRR